MLEPSFFSVATFISIRRMSKESERVISQEDGLSAINSLRIFKGVTVATREKAP